jgi:uncharacterized membrane protein YkoI
MSKSKSIVLASVFALALVGVMLALRGGDAGNAANRGAPAPGDSTSPDAPTSQTKAARKTITLADAIAVAEKHAKGRAVKAELKEKPELCFKVEVMTWEGQKTKLELNADGSVRTSLTDDKKHHEEKKGKKGRDR